MKAIDLQNGLIIKEKMFQLERDSNMLRIEFLLYPKFGEQFTKNSQASMNSPFILQVEGEDTKKLWKGVKDISSVEFTKWLYNSIFEHYPDFKKAQDWDIEQQKNPSKHMEEQEVFVNGVKTVQKVPKMNPHIEKLQSKYNVTEEDLLKKKQFPLFMVESIISFIINQGVDINDIKLIDLPIKK